MISRFAIPLRTLGICLVFGLLASCDSPTDPATHPEGVAFLTADGTEVARFMCCSTATGSLPVTVGAATTYRVRVVGEDGSLSSIDGTEYSIVQPAATIGTLAAVSLQGPDQVRIQGTAAGTTTLHFQLFHGGHEEFLVSGVPLVIR